MLQDDDDAGPPSGRDVGAEEFLFHLFRGSELLQDNRVHEAKSELEQALAQKPADPKSQDLLAVVYFRLGMYPRAIAIYESLARLHPSSVTPRVNLALCYVKTGQPELARIALERVLETNPEHARAWGYLGLTYQRLGDLERARHAFLSGGHESMARRVEELLGTAEPAAPDSERTALGLAAREAADAVDDGELRADPGATADEPPSVGTWSAHEPGREAATERSTGSGLGVAAFGAYEAGGPSSSRMAVHADGSPRSRFGSHPPGVPASFTPSFAPSSLRPSMAPPSVAPPSAVPASFGPGSFASPAWMPSGLPPALAEPTAAPTAMAFARSALLLFPRDATTVLHPGGFVLMRTGESVAARLENVRSIACSSGWTTSSLPRRARGRTAEEPLGGAASPLLSIEGRAELVLAPSAGQRLLAIMVSDEDPLTLRESALVAFESGVRYECGRMAVGEGEAIPLVQLRGGGAVVLAAPLGGGALGGGAALGAVEVESGRAALLRAWSLVGWVGALVPRVLLPSEAPAGSRGMIAFAGEGMVLVDVR